MQKHGRQYLMSKTSIGKKEPNENIPDDVVDDTQKLLPQPPTDLTADET